MPACCYFGVDLRNQLDHSFPSRQTDGTPHSSCDLLCSSPIHPFTLWTNYSQSNFPFSLLLYGQIILSPTSPSPFYSLDKLFEVQLPLLHFTLWTKYSSPNFLFALDKIFLSNFYGNLFFGLSRKFTSIHHKFSKKIPFFILAANSLQFFRQIPRQFHFLSQSKIPHMKLSLVRFT